MKFKDSLESIVALVIRNRIYFGYSFKLHLFRFIFQHYEPHYVKIHHGNARVCVCVCICVWAWVDVGRRSSSSMVIKLSVYLFE